MKPILLTICIGLLGVIAFNEYHLHLQRETIETQRQVIAIYEAGIDRLSASMQKSLDHL